ncbi:MAG: response regulator [Pelovirga sp.]
MKQLMFIDDERALLNAMARMLKPLEKQWKFIYVERAAEALDLLNTVDIDVVISDLCMPGMNGQECLERVRVQYPQVTRVMMTGRSEYDVYREGMAVAKYFLWKPVSPQALSTLLQLLSNQEATLLPGEDHVNDPPQ